MQQYCEGLLSDMNKQNDKNSIKCIIIKSGCLLVTKIEVFKTTAVLKEWLYGWKQKGSKCYWIKKQIEPFRIHRLKYTAKQLLVHGWISVKKKKLKFTIELKWKTKFCWRRWVLFWHCPSIWLSIHLPWGIS